MTNISIQISPPEIVITVNGTVVDLSESLADIFEAEAELVVARAALDAAEQYGSSTSEMWQEVMESLNDRNAVWEVLGFGLYREINKILHEGKADITENRSSGDDYTRRNC